jgi:tight adherence protein C
VVVFAGVTALVLALLWREESPMGVRLAALRGERLASAYGDAGGDAFSTRVMVPLAEIFASKLTAVLPQSFVRSLSKRLLLAGEPVTVGGFLIAALLVEGAMAGLGFVVAMASGGLKGTGLLILAGTVILGFYLPRLWLESRVRNRHAEILKSLPDAFDLVTVCVESGLGLDAALARVAEKVKGPFAEELSITLREISFGKMRREALLELADRTGVPDLSQFINAVIQAETMGTSIGQVLRVQAEQMRTRRRQRAEQQAYKAPVKMIFPLVLCIFPTLFIVILGPAGITIYDQLIKK